MIKYYILLSLIIIINLCSSQTKITIYNQDRALIQEVRDKKLKKRGKQILNVENIPNSVIPSTIYLFSDNISFITKNFINKKISKQSLLNANVGNSIELIKYDENGTISKVIIGKLLSNLREPVFEIDNKIVINPPYKYRFDHIPENISDHPILECQIESNEKNINYNLAYLTTGLSWNAEYILNLKSDNLCEIEAWYLINNKLELSFQNADISLASGIFNFNNDERGRNFNQKLYATSDQKFSYRSSTKSNGDTEIVTEIEDYSIFHIPENINLDSESTLRYKFINSKNIPYKRQYYILHNVYDYKYKRQSKENIPVFIQLQLSSNDISIFQTPQGNYNVFENNYDELTYLGTGYSKIKKGEDLIKLDIGKTHDILCSFITKSSKENKNGGEFDISVSIENRKEKAISIKWEEKFFDNRTNWKIKNANHDYIRRDASTAEFIVDLKKKSVKEINFTVVIEKN